MVATADDVSAAVDIDVPQAAAGERLDRFLSEFVRTDPGRGDLATLTRARLQRLIEQGNIRVDGGTVRCAHRLRGGERIQLRLPPPVPLTVLPEVMPLDVLFEDHDIIVLNKPAGLSVHPGAGRSSGTLVNGLLAHCADLSGIGGAMRPGIVHRLDRDTSGVLVVAKNDVAHLSLSRQFARRTVDKAYVAFVLGAMSQDAGTFDTTYGRHPTHRRRFTSRLASGRRAVTHYRVRLAVGNVSCLDVRLETGRTHQIRVHLAEHGHPIVGDVLYGGTRLERIRSPSLRAVAAQIGRHALHAARLSLVHPRTSERMTFEAPLPPTLNALWETMCAS